MASKGWHILAAFSGIAALITAAGFGAFYGSIHAPDKRHYQSIGPNSGQTYPANSPRNGLANKSGIDSLAESFVAEPKPRTPDERQDRDLAAQEAVAVFSYWMFWAMVLQTALAGGALIALLKDLSQNRESAEAQLRAYIAIQSAKLTLTDGEARCVFTPVNMGQTPASEVVCNYRTYPGKEPRPLPEKFTEGQDSRIVRVGSMGQNVPHPHAFTKPCANPQMVKALRDLKNPLSIFVDGIITYTDAFGQRHETEFGFAYQGDFGDVGISEGNMIACEGRNRIS